VKWTWRTRGQNANLEFDNCNETVKQLIMAFQSVFAVWTAEAHTVMRILNDYWLETKETLKLLVNGINSSHCHALDC
jgi:hypothetical protein